MTELIKTLTSYVPNLILNRLAVNPIPPTEATSEKFPASVLFADITGFTALTEELAKKGDVGPEELTYTLNVYVEELIDLVTFQGGDVVKFAGDALVALWRADTGEDLTIVTSRAVQTALLIQEVLHNQNVSAEIPLSLRVSVSAGDVFSAYIGGVYKRWELLVAGVPLIEMGLANEFSPTRRGCSNPYSLEFSEDWLCR